MSDLRLEQSTSFDTGQPGTLLPEIVAEASRRLGWLGLLYAGGYAVGNVGGRRLIELPGSFDASLGIRDLFSLFAIAMGLAVYVALWRGAVSSERVLDFGLGFQVAGAFGIAITEFWDGFPWALNGSLTFIPAECVWIVMFPLLVPNTPGKVLVSSLLAASAGPVALAISAAVTGRQVDRPLATATYFLATTYLSAGIAYVLARIVHRVNARLKRAREIGSYELIERIGEGGM